MAQIPVSLLKAQVSAADGTAGAPSVSFSNDTNTGLYRPGTDVMGVVTNGVERMRVGSTGNVGIGTTNPQTTLHTNGPIYITNGNLRVSGRIDIVNRRPLFMAGGNPMGVTYTMSTNVATTIGDIIYGPYAYAASQIPVASGAIRNFRIYAVYSDGITTSTPWAIRLADMNNTNNYVQYSMGSTFGATTGPSRDFLSDYQSNIVNAHCVLQIVGGAGQSPNPVSNRISYIELQTLDVYT